MAGGEERVKPATRNYVIFGLLFVGALGLAAHDWLGPERGRGEADSALRLMIVGGSPSLVTTLDEVDGFSIAQQSFDEAVAAGRELLDDPDAPAYAAAIAHADQLGFGFVALDRLGHGLPAPPDWQLDVEAPGIELGTLPPDLQGETSTVPFVVFSVGDLAPEGPRVRFVEIAPFDYSDSIGELDSVRLALYDHPDLRALWASDQTVTHLQAREVLRERGLFDRRDALAEDQAKWRELSASWPAPGTVAGSLAGPWEQVQAAPVLGGVLVDVRGLRVEVTAFRRTQLRRDESSALFFVPFAALAEPDPAADPDPVGARQLCSGLPPRILGEVAVAPDGSSLVLREDGASAATIYLFDPAAAARGECVATPVSEVPLRERGVGRSNAGARMAWVHDDDWLHWYDAGTAHQVRAPSVHTFSGPWWVDESLLAAVADAPVSEAAFSFERVLVLLDTEPDPERDPEQAEPARLDLGAAALFGPEPLAEPDPSADPDSNPDPELEQLRYVSEAKTLIDLRPSGANELLLLTERCVEEALEDMRPCVHRLRADQPLAQLVRASAGESAEGTPAGFSVETLGPLGPYLALAVASGGDRAVWVSGAEGTPRLMSAALRGPEALVATRLDDDAYPDSSPRISADGRTVLSEVTIELGELGPVNLARAFVLAPLAAPAPDPTTDAVPVPGPAPAPVPVPVPATP